MTRRSVELAVLVAATAALVRCAPARAQAPATALRLTGAVLRQSEGDLRFALRFERVVRAEDLQPRRGRTVCVVLSPERPSRRRACVQRRTRPAARPIGPRRRARRSCRRRACSCWRRARPGGRGSRASAIRRAAARVGGGVRVIDRARVFTPGGRFRQTIAFRRGRTIDARQADGIHLSPAGAAVAATLVVDRLRADRALP